MSERPAGLASRPWPAVIRLAVLALVAVLPLAGCGTLGEPGPAADGRSGSDTALTVPSVAGRAGARQLASDLLARLRLPPGAVRWGGHAPPLLRHPVGVYGSGDSVMLHRFWRLPLSPAAAAARFFAAHVPPAMQAAGSSSAGVLPPWLRKLPRDGRQPRIPARYVTLRSVSYQPRHATPGVSEAILTVAVVRASRGGSLARADVQVIWYPRRSAAEYVPPGRAGVVILAAYLLNPRPHTVTRVVRSRPAIARLARLLDAMHAMPSYTGIGCPAISTFYRVEFAASPGARPYLVADDNGCAGVGVVTGCRPGPLRAPPPRRCAVQPTLAEPGWRLLSAVARLLGVPPAG